MVRWKTIELEELGPCVLQFRVVHAPEEVLDVYGQHITAAMSDDIIKSVKRKVDVRLRRAELTIRKNALVELPGVLRVEHLPEGGCISCVDVAVHVRGVAYWALLPL
jgi:hypothetical protein